jgi:hypothetical protein
MGSTHFRSDVREKGARTASFSTVAAGALTCDSLVNAGTVTTTGLSTLTGGVSIPAAAYIKLGDAYVVVGKPTAFDLAAINVVASTFSIFEGGVPKGTMMLNASVGCTASDCLFIATGSAAWAGQIGIAYS